MHQHIAENAYVFASTCIAENYIVPSIYSLHVHIQCLIKHNVWVWVHTLPPQSICDRRPRCLRPCRCHHTPPQGREVCPWDTPAQWRSHLGLLLRWEPPLAPPDQYLHMKTSGSRRNREVESDSREENREEQYRKGEKEMRRRKREVKDRKKEER